MSVDYHGLLWQQLNKSFAGTNQAFVMTTGKFLLYSDYSLTNENTKVVERNTFKLTDTCIGCGTNYNSTGSRISLLWDQLLNQGIGPPAGPELEPAFKNARRQLYKVWDTRTPTPFYQSYIDANAAYYLKVVKMKHEYQHEYGDDWKEFYDEEIHTIPEYTIKEKLEKEVLPLFKAINEWIYGPLYSVLEPMKKAFEDNKKRVSLPDGKSPWYMNVSMTPSNWYQWFHPNLPDDRGWMTITVDENSFDARQDREYKKLGGSVSAGYSFLSLMLGGEGSQEHRIEIGNSRDVKISFKVHSVQINRPWLDPSALKINKWIIPGLAPDAWSTGVLDSSNKGSFPLLTTQLIVAKDITVTAAKFSREVTDSLTKFDANVGVGVICGLFSFGMGASGGISRESILMQKEVPLH